MAEPQDSAGGRAMRVRRTGIALVHQGELILPAAGSEAQAEMVANDDRANIVYRFPVHIEVRAGGRAIDVDAIVEETLARLAQGIDSVTL
jgi:hypothetical protein